MKRILFLAAFMAFAVISKADDRPVSADKLPAPAKSFIEEYYAGVKVTYVTKDDDLIRPDYNVMLSNGVKIDFDNSGSLEKIEVGVNAMPDGIVPVQIAEYLKSHFSEARITEYEIGRRTYEVHLSNRMELKFNSNFNLIEIDD